MVTLRHTVTVVAVPRPWTEGVVRALHDAVGELHADKDRLFHGDAPVTGIRILAGRHMAPGVRYEVADDQDKQENKDDQEVYHLTLEEWDRSSRLRLLVEGTDGDTEYRFRAELRSVDRPRDIRITGSLPYRGVGLVAALGLSWWWEQAEGAEEQGGRAPLAVELVHRLVAVTVHATVAAADGGRWRVTVTAESHGRRWAHPVLAVAATLGRLSLRRRFRDMLDATAEAWNKSVPETIGLTPEQIAAEFLADLTSG